MGAELGGPITALQQTTSGNAQDLVRYDASGKQSWSHADSHALGALAVEPSAGALYAWANASNGGGATVYQLAEDGTGEHQIDSCSDCSLSVVAASPHGDRVVLHTQAQHDGTLVVTPAGGTSWSVGSADGPVVGWAAFDPERNVIMSGYSPGAVTYHGQSLQKGAVLLKFTIDGKLLWVRQLLGDASFQELGTSAKGTVVAVGAVNGSSTWGSATVNPGTVLVTAEADGTPRWARAINSDSTTPKELAVDPEGRVALVVHASCDGATVQFWNLAGDFLWQRTFAPSECDSAHQLSGRGVGISGHDVVLGGTFSGTVDFGRGPQTATSVAGFILKLAQ